MAKIKLDPAKNQTEVVSHSGTERDPKALDRARYRTGLWSFIFGVFLIVAPPILVSIVAPPNLVSIVAPPNLVLGSSDAIAAQPEKSYKIHIPNFAYVIPYSMAAGLVLVAVGITLLLSVFSTLDVALAAKLNTAKLRDSPFEIFGLAAFFFLLLLVLSGFAYFTDLIGVPRLTESHANSISVLTKDHASEKSDATRLYKAEVGKFLDKQIILEAKIAELERQLVNLGILHADIKGRYRVSQQILVGERIFGSQIPALHLIFQCDIVIEETRRVFPAKVWAVSDVSSGDAPVRAESSIGEPLNISFSDMKTYVLQGANKVRGLEIDMRILETGVILGKIQSIDLTALDEYCYQQYSDDGLARGNREGSERAGD